MYLIFDTETTGLPKNYNAPISDLSNWPRVVQIAWQLHDDMGVLVEQKDYLIKPDDFNIPFQSQQIHGISTELANKEGREVKGALNEFLEAVSKAKYIVGQNITFDINVMGSEFYRYGYGEVFKEKPYIDTCTELTAQLCKIPGGKGGGFKYPKLSELHHFLFGTGFEEAHNATADVEATARCFFELIRTKRGLPTWLLTEDYVRRFCGANGSEIKPIGLKHRNLKEASLRLVKGEGDREVKKELSKELEEAEYANLHTHTQFSRLQSTISIKDIIKLAIDNDMPAVAMTDIGNVMGAFKFVEGIISHNKDIDKKNKAAEEKGEPAVGKKLLPIVGCEFYVCEDMHDHKNKDDGYQIIFLAKNKTGYKNITKMASKAYTEGFYYVPRIDRKLIEEYKGDIMVLSGGVNGEISQKVLSVGEKQAEEALLWWKDKFGEDFYLEMNRHGNLQEEEMLNRTLVQMSQKHGVKVVAANECFYSKKKDASTLDILLCIKNGEKITTPIGKGRDRREGMPNDEYYFKSSQEMKELFADIPEAIFNIKEIINKVEIYPLAQDILLPKFTIPKEFEQEDDPTGKKGEGAYLRHLAYEGAARKYGNITPEIRERLDFELDIVQKTGYPGYLLIVYDFVRAAKEMGVGVGPGRGSAAGSAVVYCLDITDVDPIEYDLLFERFLNPERVSMPDIDLDFEDKNREKVINYVIGKYGANQVSQIITYGTIAAKSAINDTARVMDMSQIGTMITKAMPKNGKGWSITRLLEETDKGALDENMKSKDEYAKLEVFRKMANGDGDEAKIINQAKNLEGIIRNTGVHACGVIITPEDITNFVPVTTAKDAEMWVTQFDNSVVESAGLLKMDFLGLKNLSIIKEAIRLIKINTGQDLDIEHIPKDDKKTYELFQRGETVGLFQYESLGMQKYMKQLKPTVFSDLIAMNALYRPGPIQYIPDFIERKNGRQQIRYDLDDMEEYLKETYGITVYQEQVMLISQKLAGFTKGEADSLRKAMGKKKKDVLEKMKGQFMSQATERGYDPSKLDKIWQDWEKFASYAFNKSHSTCYAWVAYQTAYLKANYPSEYMAALLTNSVSDIDTVTLYLDECHRMGIKLLPPDVNESYYNFSVDKEGNIRFGLGAVKGLATAAVDAIVEGRKEGKYTSLLDMLKRVNLKAATKKSFEIITYAGGLDSISEASRSQLLYAGSEEVEGKKETSYLEKLYKYANKTQEDSKSSQMSLFEQSDEDDYVDMKLPDCPEWSELSKLKKEKSVIGIYLSGHPLDQYKNEIRYFCNEQDYTPDDLEGMIGKDVILAGIVTEIRQVVFNNQDSGKKPSEYVYFKIEGYDGTYDFRLTKENFVKYESFMKIDAFIYLTIKVSKPKPFNNRGGQEMQNQSFFDKPRMSIENIAPLSQIYEKQADKLNIWVNEKELSQDYIQNMRHIIYKYKGGNNLCFNIYKETYDGEQDEDYSDEMQEGQDDEDVDFTEISQDVVVEEEETKLVKKTKFGMVDYSKKDKVCTMASKASSPHVRICQELIMELENNKIGFSVNG